MKADVVLERYGPPPTTELPEWLLDGRRIAEGQVRELLAIDDGQLARRWHWRDDAEGSTEVRYAFYRALEALERASTLAAAATGTAPAGSRPFALATAARWELHGILVGLHDDDLDADPGGGEWNLRQTLAHIVYVERAYPAFAAWWLTRPQTDDLPAGVPDEVGEGFPEEDDEGTGTLSEIRGRLDFVIDAAAERMAALDEAQLAIPARWSGFAVDVGFRLGRMSSHLQEHTVQVDKTLAMLGRVPSEVQRLTRLILRAYGRLEATVYAVAPEVAGGAREPYQRAVDEVRTVGEHVRRRGSITDFDDG